MTVGALPASAPSSGVVLWHPGQRAYLRRDLVGYTRRLSYAARLTVAEAVRLKAEPCHRRLEIETLTGSNQAARVPNPRRARLADLSDEELLRRAVQALCLKGGAHGPRWCVVMDALALTSAGAVQLCRRLNLDQNERTES